MWACRAPALRGSDVGRTFLGMGASTRKLTTAEQAVRWTGLGLVLAAIALGIAQVEGTQPLAGLLVLGGIGCFVAMAVMAYSNRNGGQGAAPRE